MDHQVSKSKRGPSTGAEALARPPILSVSATRTSWAISRRAAGSATRVAVAPRIRRQVVCLAPVAAESCLACRDRVGDGDTTASSGRRCSRPRPWAPATGILFVRAATDGLVRCAPWGRRGGTERGFGDRRARPAGPPTIARVVVLTRIRHLLGRSGRSAHRPAGGHAFLSRLNEGLPWPCLLR